MLTLAQILSECDAKKSEKELRQSFGSHTAVIEVGEMVVETCVILVNLTRKRSDCESLVEQATAKVLLQDSKWVSRCIKPASFLHSHNIKFPDYRRKGNIKLAVRGQLPEGFISSGIAEERRLAYAQNSSDINYAKFLCSEFSYHHSITTLGELIRNENSVFKKALLSIGLSLKQYNSLVGILNDIPECQTLTSIESQNYIQLLYPVEKESYLSISPVANHTLQYEFYQWASVNRKHSTTMSMSRPSSVGSFASELGGRIRILKSLPLITKGPCIKKEWEPWLTSDAVQNMWDVIREDDFLLTPNARLKVRQNHREQLKTTLSHWMDRYPKNKEIDDPARLTQLFNESLSRTRVGNKLAYKPSLIKVIQSIFADSKMNTHSSESPARHKPTSVAEYSYLLLPSLKVCNANALNSPYSCGLPSIIGIYGFLHVLSRNLRSIFDIELNVEDFAICIHHYSFQRRGISPEFTQIRNKQVKSAALLDSRQIDIELSILVRSKVLPELNKEQIAAALPKSFWGGHVSLSEQFLVLTGSYGSLDDALLPMENKTGSWVCHHQPTQTPITIASFLDDLKQQKALAVTCTGYQLLEPPAHKPGSIHGYKHSMVEPVLSQISLVTMTNSNRDSLWWQYSSTDQYLIVKPNHATMFNKDKNDDTPQPT